MKNTLIYKNSHVCACFNLFINILEKGIECTLSKIGDDSKLGGVADPPESRAAIQQDLKRLENWVERNLKAFSKARCRVLHLGRKNPKQQHNLGTVILKSSSAGKDLGVLGDDKLTMSLAWEGT